MSKKLFKADVIGFIFVAILGTLCHFSFEFFGESRLAALIFPVNESVWEHLKLLYFPFLFYTIGEYFALKKPKVFFYAKFCGVLWGMLFMVAFFYTYCGIIGKSVLWIDILTFLVSILISFFVSHTAMINDDKTTDFADKIGVAFLIAICVIFFVFTFSPPLIPVFKDAVLGTYGA